MTPDLERALFALNAVNDSGVDPEHFDFADLSALLEATGTPSQALETAAEAARDETERFAVAQAFVLGVRHRRTEEGVSDALHELASALLTAPDIGASEDGAGQLIDAVDALLPREQPLSESVFREAFGGYIDAFGSALQTETINESEVILTEQAAATAAMLFEVATNHVPCRWSEAKIMVGNALKNVLLVEIDVCSNLLFDRCRRGIDPFNWPSCNPYFVGVDLIGSKTQSPTGDGWAALIREKVGPAMNFKYYTTDLAVRYFEATGVAAVAYDLAPGFAGPVTVDRGFLSVTDEGTHRRLRVLKVYRVENLKTAPSFACQLWAMQVALSGWWCP